jgi:hypothetical protein
MTDRNVDPMRLRLPASAMAMLVPWHEPPRELPMRKTFPPAPRRTVMRHGRVSGYARS